MQRPFLLRLKVRNRFSWGLLDRCKKHITTRRGRPLLAIPFFGSRKRRPLSLAALPSFLTSFFFGSSLLRSKSCTDPFLHQHYSAIHPLCRKVLKMRNLGIPQLGVSYCNYLLPKQTLAIFSDTRNKTLWQSPWIVLYIYFKILRPVSHLNEL